MFSSGAGSWAAARRVADEYGTEGLVLLFADTLIEDEDNYRFLDEAAADIGGQLVKVSEGRDPWQVFRDRRFIGNTRADVCSRILKREYLRKWLDEHCDPERTVVYVGIDWSEQHRLPAIQANHEGWKVEAPLCERPLISKQDALDDLRARGIEPPRLYAVGFAHANCGGGCVKAGQAQFELLLRWHPERYRWWEEQEQGVRELLAREGEDVREVAILRDRTGGDTRPLTLREFRERLEAQPSLFDADDWGAGCAACFAGPVAA